MGFQSILTTPYSTRILQLQCLWHILFPPRRHHWWIPRRSGCPPLEYSVSVPCRVQSLNQFHRPLFLEFFHELFLLRPQFQPITQALCIRVSAVATERIVRIKRSNDIAKEVAVLILDRHPLGMTSEFLPDMSKRSKVTYKSSKYMTRIASAISCSAMIADDCQRSVP